MGHPLSSESGNCIQKWILYHAIQDPTDFWLNWDITDPDDIKLLQEYVESNGSVVYLPSSTVKSLLSLRNYIYLLIKRGRPVDQKCNVLYFLLDDHVENSNTRLLLISCSQGILSSSSFSCYLLLRLLVYMYLSQLMRTFTNYLRCIVISS